MADDVLVPADAAALALSRRLLRTASRASLATLEPDTGWPYASLVTVASTLEGMPLLLVSSLSLHSRALAADPRCSLLVDTAGPGDPLAHPRLTVFGRAEFIDRSRAEGVRLRQRFLSRHPKAALYADFGDFSFVTIRPDRGLLYAGFGRASALTANDLPTSMLNAALEPMRESEAAAIAHLNTDHRDAVRMIAVRLGGGADGDWQVIGLDPEGVDFALGGRYLRYTYSEPLKDAKMLRTRLAELTRQAREGPEPAGALAQPAA